MSDLDLVQAGRGFADHCHRLHPAGAEIVARMADEIERLRIEIREAAKALNSGGGEWWIELVADASADSIRVRQGGRGGPDQ